MSGDTVIQWTAELSVSHEVIDLQHQELIGFLARLQDSIISGDAALTDKLLDDLVRYTRWHFAEEEVLMRDSKYPHYLDHIMRHESLLEEIDQLKRSIEAGRTPVSLALLGFLTVWLMEHIKTSDRRLGKFLAGVVGYMVARSP